MGYLSVLIYHTDLLVQLVSILYHVGPRGMGYLSDRIFQCYSLLDSKEYKEKSS
jgi:hypothetical protein